MVNILIEIGTEEIPARFMKKMLTELKQKSEEALISNRLEFAQVKTLGTDRRLALFIEGLLETQSDLDNELKGPPANIAYKNGELTQAGLGFCKKNKLDPQNITTKEIAGKQYLFAKIFEKGLPAKQLLPEIYTKVLASLHLPIAMRWGELDVQFIRPIHWILALYGEQALEFEFAKITSSNYTWGHRFFSNKQIVVHNPEEYINLLEENKVLADNTIRKDTIEAQIKIIEKEKGLTAVFEESLLEEITFINEYPHALVAEIDTKYLSIPQECLILTMQKNQKYIPLVDKQGKLSKYFILFTNNFNNKSVDNIISGNVKVVTARLEDAKFFYEEDLKADMDQWVENMKNVTFQENIGSVYEKIKRIVALSSWLSQEINLTKDEQKLAIRAAKICKGDLNSKMVYEFTELQGVMGKYYALAAGENKEVADVMLDHWKPRFAGEDISNISNISAVVSIADKIDSITGCFCVGLIPTSSSDPYALRRAAQGIVNILATKNISLDINKLIAYSLSLYDSKQNELQQTIAEFFNSRLKFLLQEREISYDVINAITKTTNTRSLVELISLAKDISKNKSKLKGVSETSTRLSNILKAEKEAPLNQLNEQIMNNDEKILTKALTAVKEINLETLQQLVPIIDTFFEKVMVMDKDNQIKNNRLLLVTKAQTIFDSLAKFSELIY